tara:strand:- start:604 stop:2325 length:1722 start_codon:yes stop_codon:yes gene_type:complete
MAKSDDILKNLDDILPNFAKFLSRYGTGDKQVADWDKSSMVVKSSGSKLILKPNIKKNDKRGAFANDIKNHFVDSSGKLIEKNINVDLIGETLILSSTSQTKLEIDNEFKRPPTTESKNAPTFYIKVFEIRDNRRLTNPMFTFAIVPKASSKGAKKPDPHELMTACLILLGEPVDEKSLNSSDSLHEDVKVIVDKCYKKASKVGGGSGLEGFYLDNSKEDPDLVNFAKAYSASNYILSVLPTNYSDLMIWQTGQSWANEIKKFAGNDEIKKEIKTYNSSDIVIRFRTGTGSNQKTHFWGISLKKRGMSNINTADKEPTLLNKPVIDLIRKYTPSSEVKKIEDAKLKFFKNALKIKYSQSKKNTIVPNLDSWDMKKVLKECDAMFFEKDKAAMLRGQGEYSNNPNIYFEEIDRVFLEYCGKKNIEPFFHEFLDLIFKVDMDTYINDGRFHFSLITGTGDFNAKKGMFISEKALEKYGKTTTSIFRKMLGKEKTKYILMKDPSKKNAFERGSTAAKLFYILKLNNVSIVDIEVRYKGSLTAQPQFQVFMSVRKPNFSRLYKKYAGMFMKGKNRWD